MPSKGWCRRRGSKPHGFIGHWILSPARLPIPPHRHGDNHRLSIYHSSRKRPGHVHDPGQSARHYSPRDFANASAQLENLRRPARLPTKSEEGRSAGGDALRCVWFERWKWVADAEILAGKVCFWRCSHRPCPRAVVGPLARRWQTRAGPQVAAGTSVWMRGLGWRLFLRCQSGRDFLALGLKRCCSKRKIAAERRRARLRAATGWRTRQ